MSVVEHYHGIVPFSVRVDLHLRFVRKIHGVVHPELLPFLELFREVRFVYELVFRARYIRDSEFRPFHHMIEHPAVASLGELPVP